MGKCRTYPNRYCLYLQDDVDTRDDHTKPGLFYAGNHVYFLTLKASVIANGVIPDDERPYAENVNLRHHEVSRIIRSLKHRFTIMQLNRYTLTCYKNIENSVKIVIDVECYKPQYDHTTSLPLTYLRVSELSTSHTFE